LKKAKQLNELHGVKDEDLDYIIDQSESDSVDQLVMNQLLSGIITRNKFKID